MVRGRDESEGEATGKPDAWEFTRIQDNDFPLKITVLAASHIISQPPRPPRLLLAQSTGQLYNELMVAKPAGLVAVGVSEMRFFQRMTLLAVCLSLAGCGQGLSNDDVDRLLELDQRYNAGDAEYVIEQATAYVQQYPKSHRGWSLIGWAHVDLEQLSEARDCFRKALQIEPSWDNGYVGLGVVCRREGKLAEARENYLQAIRLVPDNAEAFSSLLVIELMEGNDKLAVEYGERAWAIRDNYASIPANLSIAYHYLGDEQKRDEYFEHAKRLNYDRLDSLLDVFSGEASIR